MMQIRKLALILRVSMSAALLLILSDWSGFAVAKTARTDPFATASVRFEQNATDGDVEVVFEAKGGDDGLAHLKVISPDGRTVIDFNAPDATTLGIRQFIMESPEPDDVAALKAAYPEGKYEFRGKTLSGKTLAGTSGLRYSLPPITRIKTPVPKAKNVSAGSARISWSAVAGVAHYIVDIEQDELGMKLKAVLPRGTTSFAVPDGILLPGTEYELAIGTISETTGNISYVETSFTTAK